MDDLGFEVGEEGGVGEEARGGDGEVVGDVGWRLLR